MGLPDPVGSKRPVVYIGHEFVSGAVWMSSESCPAAIFIGFLPMLPFVIILKILRAFFEIHKNGGDLSELKPNPNYKVASLDMMRYVVPPCQETPTMHSDIDIYELAKILSENELYTLVQDVTMSPHIKPDGFKPSVKFVSWSPPMNSDFRSLLTLLTDAGGLNIYYRVRNEWINIQSISNLWVELCRKKWDATQNFDTSHEVMCALKKRTYKIKINAFCWSEADPEKNASILFFVTKDGTIVLLEIKGIENPFFEVRLLTQFETNVLDVSCITCFKISNFKYLIYFASINGKIYGTSVELSPKAYDSSENVPDENATFGPPFCIWNEDDRIQIFAGGISITEFSQRKFLFVAKGAHLIIFALNNDGTSFKHDITSFDDIMITGLNLINCNEVIITTRSAIFTSIKIDFSNNDFTKETEIIENTLKNDYYACFGIALSPNKVIAYVPLSVKTAYDHLQLRECANTYWCALTGIKNPSTLIDRYEGATADIWDALEVSRIFHQKKIETLKIHPLSDYDAMNIYTLQRQLWCINSILVTEVSPTATTDLMEHKEAIVTLIRLHSVQNWCNKILTTLDLNEFTVKSLNAIMMWLSTLNLDPRFENMNEGVGQLNLILDTSEIPRIKDSCEICGDGVIEVKTDAVLCRNNHSVPICPISYTQVADVDHFICSICNAIFHKETVNIEKQCLFCDGVLRLNDLLLKDYENS